MSRMQEISDFLEYFKKVYIQNPETKVPDKSFYNKLSTYALEMDPNVDLSNPLTRDIKPLFNKWEDHFRHTNLLVYFDERQNRFLQFRNTKGVGRDEIGNCYKLYLSFPKDKMEECVNDVFSFIEKNKMPNISKVADVVRADSVVLRIYHAKDAMKVMDYINSNKKLVNAAMPTNPFLQRNGVVGMGYDFDMSYNSVISSVIKNYFEDCKDRNDLNSVSLQGLKGYVNNLYNGLDNGKNINHIVSKIIGTSYPKNDKEERILNVKHILQIFKDSLDETKTLDNYINSVISFQDNKKQEQEKETLKSQLLNNQQQMIDELEPNRMGILNQYIIYATKKYGINNVHGYLMNYVNGNPNGITRDNNFRELFTKYVPPSFIVKMIGNNIEKYINNYMESHYRHYYEKACMATLRKYGMEQLTTALSAGIYGSFRYFTNDDNVRNDLMENVPIEVFQKFAAYDLEKTSTQIRR